MNNQEAIEFLEEAIKMAKKGNIMPTLQECGGDFNKVISLLKRGKAYEKKAKRLEIIIADFSLWLKANHKTMKIKDAAIYWKKLIEDYVFEQVGKVIEALSKVTETKEAKQEKPEETYNGVPVSKIKVGLTD